MACFSRPEFSTDRVSYPVMPFSAARGILTGVLAKSTLEWRVNRIFVLSPIRFLTMGARHEIKDNGEPTLARTIFLRNPEYVIEAQIELLSEQTIDANLGKYEAMFLRYRDRGSLIKPVFLGMRECLALVGPPPTNWRTQARTANPEHDPFLGRMPLTVTYSETGRPERATFVEFEFDAAAGSYEPVRS